MKRKFSFDVFLSHNSKDKSLVRRLAERLQSAGLRVWFDEWVIRPGDDIFLAVERGLHDSRAMVLCLSPNALSSDWVGLERSTVLFRDPSNVGRRFIPLLLADCDLPDTLRRYKYLDYRDEDTAFLELLKAFQPGDQVQELSHRNKKGSHKNKQIKFTAIAKFERELEGHKGRVDTLSFAPNSKWCVSGAGALSIGDFSVRVWDLDSGDCKFVSKFHKSNVNCVCVIDDGTRIVSASSDKIIWIYNFKTEHYTKCIGHKSAVTSVAILPNSRKIISGSCDNSFKIWDTTNGACLDTFETTSSVYSVAISSSGEKAYIGCINGEIILFDVNNRQVIGTYKEHVECVKSICITPDNLLMITGGGDNTVIIWDAINLKKLGTIEFEKNIFSIDISPDSSMMAVVSSKMVRLIDIKSGACIQEIDKFSLKPHKRYSPVSVSFSPDGARLLVGGAEGGLYAFRISTIKPTFPVELTRRYVNAKVVLIGESTVGKTTLAHRLIEDCYVKPDSTHGMNVWRLDLPDCPQFEEASSSLFLTDKNVVIEREALLWDLAGQEDYRLIHQLYLEETALALLLINPQKDDPFAEAKDWLKALKAAVTSKDANHEVACLLIATRHDVGGVKVSQKKIDRFLQDYGFLDWLSTGAKRGDNCSDIENGNQPSKLKQLISRHIPWDRLPWTATPRLLAEIKNAVVTMRDKADVRLLRFAELAQRLEQAMPTERIGEADIRTAVMLLANHGLVRLLKFGDLVLLRPDLLNGYAGAIIRAARAHKDEIGCVTEEAIYSDEFDFTGVERLVNRSDEELLLRALVQTLLDFSLCIRESEGGDWLLIFPSQYRRDRDIPGHPEIFVTYTFNGELQTIYTTLVVRLWYSRTFKQKELWQNAAEFTTSKGHSVGVVFDKIGDGEGTLSVFFDSAVPDELKVVFIEFVHRHLERYSRDLRRERRYVCINPSCLRPFKDVELIRELLADGEKTIVCQKCRTEVELVDHIEQCVGSDPVAKKVVAMDARATHELDNQSLEQILIGHMMAICGEANQIFKPNAFWDYGIDGEVEFRDNNGKASGKKIYVQLKSGDSYLRTRKADGKEIFDVKDPRHLEYWVSQPVDVYLVIRHKDETTDQGAIRWMNITRYLKKRVDKTSRQIVFNGEKLDAPAVWRVRDGFFAKRD